MYSKIVNPQTGRKVLINGRLGRQILKNYVTILIGGFHPDLPTIPEELEEMGSSPTEEELLLEEETLQHESAAAKFDEILASRPIHQRQQVIPDQPIGDFFLHNPRGTPPTTDATAKFDEILQRRATETASGSLSHGLVLHPHVRRGATSSAGGGGGAGGGGSSGNHLSIPSEVHVCDAPQCSILGS